MSLILATHRDPEHYALAADSRATSSGPVSSVAKRYPGVGGDVVVLEVGS